MATAAHLLITSRDGKRVDLKLNLLIASTWLCGRWLSTWTTLRLTKNASSKRMGIYMDRYEED